MIYVTAATATIAAVVAVSMDRCERFLASSLALVAGLLPWIAIWGLNQGINTTLFFIGLFGSAPLFLIAFFLYGTKGPGARQVSAAIAAILGMFLGVMFSFTVIGCISQMP